MGHLRYDDKSDGDLSREMMVGIAVGCSLQIVIIAMIIVACCVYYRKQHTEGQNENARQKTNRQVELVHMPSI